MSVLIFIDHSEGHIKKASLEALSYGAKIAEQTGEIEETGGETGDLRSLSLDELNKLLNEVLEQEDYLKAIAIRDEINNRKKNRG